MQHWEFWYGRTGMRLPLARPRRFSHRADRGFERRARDCDPRVLLRSFELDIVLDEKRRSRNA